MRPKTIIDKKKRTAMERFYARHTLRETAKQFGVDYRVARRELVAHGVTIRPRFNQ